MKVQRNATKARAPKPTPTRSKGEAVAKTSQGATSQGRVVLLPHPGGERGPSAEGHGSCPWPDAFAAHRRKFLKTAAEYVAAPGRRIQRGDVGVWCEYEGPTLAKPCAGAARWLHTMDSCSPGSSPDPEESLNTDPWIWSEGFVWSICRRLSKAEQRVVSQLCRGDVVVFGSSIRDCWRMDTVMVIGREEQTGESRSPAYARYVLGPLHDFVPRPVHRGVIHGQGERFSFAPVQTGRLDVAVGRVDITQLLTQLRKDDGKRPSARNSQALVACHHPTGGPEAFWEALVQATLAAGLSLGVRFSHPLDTSAG